MVFEHGCIGDRFLKHIMVANDVLHIVMGQEFGSPPILQHFKILIAVDQAIQVYDGEMFAKIAPGAGAGQEAKNREAAEDR